MNNNNPSSSSVSSSSTNSQKTTTKTTYNSIDNPTLTLPSSNEKQRRSSSSMAHNNNNNNNNNHYNHNNNSNNNNNEVENFQDIDIGDIENGNGNPPVAINRFTSHQSNSSTSLQDYYQDSDEIDGEEEEDETESESESSEDEENGRHYDHHDDGIDYSNSGTEVSSSSSYASDSSYDGEESQIILNKQFNSTSNSNKNEVRLNMESDSEVEENGHQYSTVLLQRKSSSIELSSTLNSSGMKDSQRQHRKHLMKRNSRNLSISGAGETRKQKEVPLSDKNQKETHNRKKKHSSRVDTKAHLDTSMSGSKYSQLSQSQKKTRGK